MLGYFEGIELEVLGIDNRDSKSGLLKHGSEGAELTFPAIYEPGTTTEYAKLSTPEFRSVCLTAPCSSANQTRRTHEFKRTFDGDTVILIKTDHEVSVV